MSISNISKTFAKKFTFHKLTKSFLHKAMMRKVPKIIGGNHISSGNHSCHSSGVLRSIAKYFRHIIAMINTGMVHAIFIYKNKYLSLSFLSEGVCMISRIKL
jgi:hypothetical protein